MHTFTKSTPSPVDHLTRLSESYEGTLTRTPQDERARSEELAAIDRATSALSGSRSLRALTGVPLLGGDLPEDIKPEGFLKRFKLLVFNGTAPSLAAPMAIEVERRQNELDAREAEETAIRGTRQANIAAAVKEAVEGAILSAAQPEAAK